MPPLARATGKLFSVDPHLEALLCAQEIAKRRSVENPPLFVCADARALPFAEGTFGGAFSYSVVQHFSREDAGAVLREIGRVLCEDGAALVQMPNVAGVDAHQRHAARIWRRRGI